MSGKLSNGRLVSDFTAEYTPQFVDSIMQTHRDSIQKSIEVGCVDISAKEFQCLAAEIPSLEPDIPETDESQKDMISALKKLHANLGHPSAQDLVRVLRRSGASEQAVAAAKSLECAVCLNSKQPASALPANTHRSMNFNDKIGLDVMYLAGWKPNQRVPCISIVDYASSLHIVAPIFERENAEIIKGVLRDSWIAWAGVPSHLEVDPAKPNISEALAEYCESLGITLRQTAADAHYQLGKVERHGQWFAKIFERVCNECPPQSPEGFVDHVIHTQQAKNSLISEAGASPCQIVFGKNPRIPQDLLQDQPDLGASEAILSDDTWARANQVRQAARKVVLECQDDRALRAALRARPRPHRDVKSGDWVYYWRSQKWQNGVLMKGGKWYGAALVLGHIGRNIVVAHRRSILRCAPERVRPASSEEATVAEFPESERSTDRSLKF